MTCNKTNFKVTTKEPIFQKNIETINLFNYISEYALLKALPSSRTAELGINNSFIQGLRKAFMEEQQNEVEENRWERGNYMDFFFLIFE